MHVFNSWNLQESILTVCWLKTKDNDIVLKKNRSIKWVSALKLGWSNVYYDWVEESGLPVAPQCGLVFVVAGPEEEGRVVLEAAHVLANFGGHRAQKPLAGRIHRTGEHQVLPYQYAQPVRSLSKWTATPQNFSFISGSTVPRAFTRNPRSLAPFKKIHYGP